MEFDHDMDHEPELISGNHALDFANTVEPRGGPSTGQPPGDDQRDYVPSYTELVRWSVRADLLTDEQGWALLEAAKQHPRQSQQVFARAMQLREAIYRIFWSVARGKAVAPADLALLSEEYRAGQQQLALAEQGGRFVWEWHDESAALDRMLWPIVEAAVALLTNGEQARIKVCPGSPGQTTPCAWLFYDTSKNRSRQWCSMGDCGSVTKASRQTARRRAARKSTSS